MTPSGLAPRAGASPLRQLALLGGLTAAVLGGLVLHAGVVEAGAGRGLRPTWTAPPDSTDSTDADSLDLDSLGRALDSLALGALDGALVPPDSLDPDSLDADSTEADSTERALRYLPGVPRALRRHSASIVAPTLPGLRGRLGTYWRRSVTLDSAAYAYAIREAVGETDVRAPADVSFAQYLEAQRQAALAGGFRSLATQRTAAGRQRQGVGFTVDIPGGQTSAFRTLFGRNEVDLTVSGRSDVDLGVNYNANALNEALTGRGGSVDPAFGQELNLNVAGTIGDKLRINVNYDTQSQFEFENQVSLVYTGYQDDIIQRIEAGNVFLQTPSELIRGGQRLFGLRTDLQFGPLALTAVASQQDAETTGVTIEGGSQATPFSLAPYEYEDNTHFFLGYFFHNWWDAAHRQPGLPTNPPGINQITNIEVWKYDRSLNTSQTDGAEIIYAIALADLAEPQAVLAGGEEYLAQYPDPAFTPRPDSTADRYTDADLVALRTTPQIDPGQVFSLPPTAYANTRFRRLSAEIDYVYDNRLGWLSLTTPLSEEDILAVSYEYSTGAGENQRSVYVGDFGRASQSTTPSGPKTILKLLRSSIPTPSAPLWDLTMRNVYRVGGRGLTQSAFSLGVSYEAPSQPPRDVIQNLTFGDQQTLLQVLGLDRVNLQNTTPPDDLFDFTPGLTVDPGNGRIIFPQRQPFGDYLANLIVTGQTLSGDVIEVVPPDGTTREQAAAQYSFEDLYEEPRSTAARLNGLSRYRIAGEFRSAAQSVFNVGFNIVPSTVVVTSGGRRLVEGADYRVNATAGTVEIINPIYLAAGQQIRVEAEQNRLFAIGSKTLLGLRADYRIAQDAGLGLTWMRLAERPLVDKFRVGEEALQNTIFGIDGRYSAEPRWLTRALDWLPLVQTSATSRFEVRGEVAQLNPGHPQTLAFERTRRTLADAPDNVSLPEDELGGLSYLDDFEGSENAFTALGETAGWRLAAAPDSAGPRLGPFSSDTPVTSVNRPTNWRGLFSWYTVNREVYRQLTDFITPAAQPVLAGQLFPDRGFATNDERNQPLPLLDLYFDPSDRGPYNYNGDLGGVFASRPQDVWGGMIRPVDGSYADFEGQNNVEFVELLVAPLGGRNGTEPIAPGARLYLDLGRLSEDVIPDRSSTPNTEDGIRDTPPASDELSIWGRLPGGQPSGAVDFFRETGRTEDLGLDGLPSRVADVAPGGQPYTLDEVAHFADFIALVPEGTLRSRAIRDPSADDYHHFGEEAFFDDPRFFPSGASLQERFAYAFPSYELNSIQAYSSIVQSGREGISNQPNTEDINGDGQTTLAEAYHRYEVPLDAAGLATHPFVQSTIAVGDQTFYLLRIPVRTSLRTSTGLDSTDFSRIESVRVWTTGHDRPATLRIASFELVGSQWLKSDEVGTETDPGADAIGGLAPNLFIESINNEKSPNVYAIPRTAIRSEARSASGAVTPSREQSIVFRAENVADGQSAGIVRAFGTRPYDLSRYSNLRMFVHGDSFRREDSVRVFVRIGGDETENYYEYEQPVYPFDPARAAALNLTDNARADSLWQTNVPLADGTTIDLNSVNIVLSELNRLKVARDEARWPVTEPFEGAAAPEGAPPQARIRIVGQPSINDVRTVVLGIRNGRGGSDVPLDTIQVWFNELRVSGYDEAGGASGFLTANLALADLATMSARLSFTQDGFGDLGGGLGTRDFADRSAFSFTSNFQAHKLLPERFGWSIPVTYSVTQSGTTPRFDPERGDIRLDDLREAILADTSATAPAEPERQIAADALLERAQTVSGSRNFRVQATKTGSRSPWLRYTLDGLSASFSTNTLTGRSPASLSNESDQWTANAGYRVTVPRPRTVRPLWFAGDLPLLGSVLGGLRLNWLPQSFTFTTDLARSIASQQPRPQLAFSADPDSVQAFRTRRRTTQTFTHGRTLDLQHNPFSFLRLSYGSNTDQDFGAAGQVETSRVLVYRPATDSTAAFTQSYDLTPEEARLDSLVRRDLILAFGDDIPTDGSLPGFVQILGGPTLDVVPFGTALGSVFGGDGVRTRGYTQTLQATLSVSTRRVRWLSWIRPQALSYRTNYGWNDIPLPTDDPDLRVAGARTQVQLQTGIQFIPRDFWRLFPFYRRLEAAAGRAPAGPRAPAGTPAGRPDAQAPAASDSTVARAGFNPFAGVRTLPRTLFLAATGITDVSMTYRGSLASSANGLLGGNYSLLSALTGEAPSLGYRLGLSRTIPIGTRLNDDSLRLALEDRLGDQHALEARTTLEPLPQLRIGLMMQTQWTRDTSTPFSYADDGTGAFVLTEGQANTRGTGTSTVWAVGGSYASLVERHAERFRRDIEGTPNEAGAFSSDVLTRNGLAQDFQREFGRGLGRYGPGGVFPIPLPGWDVTYSGLSRWPVFRSLAQQVTLRHNYSATNQTAYSAFFTPPTPRTIGTGESAVTLIPTDVDGASDEVTTLTANQAFQPLLGLQVTWKAGLQTSLNWERSDLYTLQTQAAQLTTKEIENLRLEVTWAKTGFRLFGLRRLNNNLTFNLAGSIFNDETINHPLGSDVLATIAGAPLDDTQPIRTRRYQITPRLGYTISNQVTASIFGNYTRSEPRGGTAVPTTDFDGGVSLRILFSN